jgi:hypothetical protein
MRAVVGVATKFAIRAELVDLIALGLGSFA